MASRDMSKMIKVEVAYAREDKQRIYAVLIEPGSSIEAVIISSGILTEFPEIDLPRSQVGVFSKQRQLADEAQDGDRIEIYRPLTIDPKEARRAKAKKLKNLKR